MKLNNSNCGFAKSVHTKCLKILIYKVLKWTIPQLWRKRLRLKIPNDMLEVLKRSRGLTSFNLTDVGQKLYLNEEQSENLKKCLYQCPNLKKVVFTFYSTTPKIFTTKFFSGFEHMNVRELHLKGGWGFVDWGTLAAMEKSSFKKSLETFVGNFPKLQYLCLDHYFLPLNRRLEFKPIIEEIALKKICPN